MQGNPVKNPGPLFVITYAVLIGCRAFGRKMGTWNGGNGPERVLIFNAGCDRPWNVQVPQPRAVQPRNPPSSLPGRPQCSPEPCNTGIAIVPAASPPNAMVLLHTCRCRQGHLFSLQRSHRPPDAIRRTICRNFFRLLCPVPDDETVIVHGNGDASMQGTCHCMPCVAARVGVYAMTARILVFRFCHIAVQLFFKKSAHIHYMHRYIG